MTLGGLALAVGILVDDSTVTIENTHRLLEEGDAVRQGGAGRRGRHRRTDLDLDAGDLLRVRLGVLPAGRGALSCSRRSPWRWCSPCSPPTLISRTLTPIIIRLLLRAEHDRHGSADRRVWRGSTRAFNARFDRFRDFYGWLLAGILRHRVMTPAVAGADRRRAPAAVALRRHRFLPARRCRPDPVARPRPARTRIERTEQIFQAVEDNIRTANPAQRTCGLMLDNFGLPQRSSTISPSPMAPRSA